MTWETAVIVWLYVSGCRMVYEDLSTITASRPNLWVCMVLWPLIVLMGVLDDLWHSLRGS